MVAPLSSEPNGSGGRGARGNYGGGTKNYGPIGNRKTASIGTRRHVARCAHRVTAATGSALRHRGQVIQGACGRCSAAQSKTEALARGARGCAERWTTQTCSRGTSPVCEFRKNKPRI